MWGEFARRYTLKIFNLVKSEVCACNSRLSVRCARYSSGSSSEGRNDSLGEIVDDEWTNKSHEEKLKLHKVATHNPAADASGKYRVFRDEDSEIILDVEEERRKLETELESVEVANEFAGINLKRGVTGVLDIEELVEILEQQKAKDVVVIQVPPSYCYVSYMVVATGNSTRHLVALTEFLRKVYKRKMSRRDPMVRVEGENSKNWVAVDLGNIALHIFLKSTREQYDLESLWSLGADYDNLCQKKDNPLISLLENSIGLGGMEPASSSSSPN